MNNLKVYYTNIEFNYNKPSAVSLIGGFVYGFVQALDAREALHKFTNELKRQDIAVKEVEFISPYEVEMEWETAEQTNKFVQLYKKAKSVNQVIFDDFYSYENDD